jgi:RNA polymerase sigma-70 factor (ECF subfamily)
LEELCRTYWYPLYAYIRRRGNGPVDAEDLTQAFFARLLAKNFVKDVIPGTGRFRSFLLTALKHFLANEWDRSQAQKRGSGKLPLSLDDDQAEARYRIEAVDHTTPETLYEQRWAWTVLGQVFKRLRQEFVATEKAELFDHLKGFLSAAAPQSTTYSELAARTGLKEGTVKVAVHRLRRRYGELLRAQVAQTVADPGEVEDELRYLVQVLSR